MTKINLPVPPSTNTYWRHVGARVLISAKGRAYRADVLGHCIEQGVVGRALYGRLKVHVDYSPPDRRRRDLDNVFKALLDAISYARVWVDDEQIDELSITRLASEKPGGVLVSIEVINGE